MSNPARFVKVVVDISGHDSDLWVNADHVVAVLDKTDYALLVTTTGTYRSVANDYIDILCSLDLIINEDHGVATAGLEVATRATRAARSFP